MKPYSRRNETRVVLILGALRAELDCFAFCGMPSRFGLVLRFAECLRVLLGALRAPRWIGSCFRAVPSQGAWPSARSGASGAWSVRVCPDSGLRFNRDFVGAKIRQWFQLGLLTQASQPRTGRVVRQRDRRADGWQTASETSSCARSSGSPQLFWPSRLFLLFPVDRAELPASRGSETSSCLRKAAVGSASTTTPQPRPVPQPTCKSPTASSGRLLAHENDHHARRSLRAA